MESEGMRRLLGDPIERESVFGRALVATVVLSLPIWAGLALAIWLGNGFLLLLGFVIAAVMLATFLAVAGWLEKDQKE